MNEKYSTSNSNNNPQQFKLEPVDISGPSEPQGFQQVPRDSNISALEEDQSQYQPPLSLKNKSEF